MAEDLAELKKKLSALANETSDARKQMIRVLNTLGNLTAELRSVKQHQERERKGLTVNSVGTYLLFVVLVATGFYLLYSSQVERLDSEKNTLVRERAATQNRLTQLRKAAEGRREAESKAARFHRLCRSGQVHKALAAYPEIAQLPLSPVESAVFQDWVATTKSKLAYSAYSEAMHAVGESEWKRAVSRFRAATRYLKTPPHEASLRYYLAVSLMKLGNYKEAADEFERAIALGAEKSVSKELRYYLGECYLQMTRREKAIQAFRGYIKRHPNTGYARLARRKIKQLK